MKNAYEGWGVFWGTWAMTSGLFCFWLFMNILLGSLIGASAGWLLSFVLIGDWISEGLGIFFQK